MKAIGYLDHISRFFLTLAAIGLSLWRSSEGVEISIASLGKVTQVLDDKVELSVSTNTLSSSGDNVQVSWQGRFRNLRPRLMSLSISSYRGLLVYQLRNAAVRNDQISIQLNIHTGWVK